MPVARRLLIRPGAIGDVILALPALAAARSGYTEMWVPAAAVPLIRCADRVDAISRTGIDLLELPGQPQRAGLVARLESFDSIVSWYGANRPEFRDAVAALGLPFQFLDALPPKDTIHAADFFLRQAGGQGTAVPRIECPRGELNGAVIHPFSGSTRKNWPLDRFRELKNRLEARLPVAWCAGPEERLDDAIRIADLYELACRLAQARVYVGNDSGITHLAAAAGAPVVALFGPTDPAVWAPRGARVRVVKSESMDRITIAEVADAVASLL